MSLAEDPMRSRYLRIKGTIKVDQLAEVRKIISEMYYQGKMPMEFVENRWYYYLKSDRQDEVLQFIERSNKTFSILYRGPTSSRKDNLRDGAGNIYACSEEGGGWIQETGFVPVKIKKSKRMQWTVGDRIYLTIYEVEKCVKGTREIDVKKDKTFFFEVVSFCPSQQIQSIESKMRQIVQKLQPYFIVTEKRNIGS